MRSYRYGELGFSAPEAWTDVSVVTFTGPSGSTVTLTREAFGGRKTLEAYAKRRLPELRRTMKKHRLVSKGPVEVGGTSAYRFEHRFVSDRVPVHQLQYFFENGGEIAVLALTCAADAFAEHRRQFESIAASLRREETRDA